MTWSCIADMNARERASYFVAHGADLAGPYAQMVAGITAFMQAAERCQAGERPSQFNAQKETANTLERAHRNLAYEVSAFLVTAHPELPLETIA